MATTKLTADDLLALLAVKHSKDVFVPECKGGGTWNSHYIRMDAWAMARSWAKPLVRGYEIKVSRSDFLGDDKWQNYLPLCDQFYFVCPSGLIAPNELPKEVGLLWASTGGARLYTKKKAAHRDVKLPESLFRYILMSRCRIDAEGWGDHGPETDYWRRWLAAKDEAKEIGRNVSKTLGRLVSERITTVEVENKRLKAENERLAEIQLTLEALGFKEGVVPSKYLLDGRLKELRRGFPDRLPNTVSSAIHSLKCVQASLKQFTDTEGGA